MGTRLGGEAHVETVPRLEVGTDGQLEGDIVYLKKVSMVYCKGDMLTCRTLYLFSLLIEPIHFF